MPLGWIAVCSTLTGMLLSGARAPLAGLLAGGGRPAVLLPAKAPGRSCSARPSRRDSLAVFVFSAPGERLRARIFWATHEPLGGARPLLWRDTLPLAATHLLAGVGPENFVSEFPRYQSLELARAFPDFYHESPHNLLLDSLAGEGLLSTLVLLALLVMALKNGLSGGAGVRSRVIAAGSGGSDGCTPVHRADGTLVDVPVCGFGVADQSWGLRTAARAALAGGASIERCDRLPSPGCCVATGRP